MKFLNSTVAKWAARTHLAGTGVVLAAGMHQGHLFAMYDHALVTAFFNPFVVGVSIGITGVAKSLLKLDQMENSNAHIDATDESRSDLFTDDTVVGDDQMFSDTSYVDYEIYDENPVDYDYDNH